MSHPANHLGNCLRSILSSKILAESIGAEFAIDLSEWHTHRTAAPLLPILFKDLILTKPTPPSIPMLDEQSCMRFTKLYGTNSEPDVEAVFNPKESLPTEGFALAHIYAARPAHMETPDYLLAKHQEYRKLAFPEYLKEAVRTFSRRNDLRNLVGVHIRHTDNLRDPRKTSLNTPVPIFERKMRRIFRTGRSILLCTDDNAVRDHFRTAYAQYVTLPDAVNPAFQPLYEMMLLAETSRVLGTYSSTFSYEACLFNGTDLELFDAGTWRTYRFSSVHERATAENCV